MKFTRKKTRRQSTDMTFPLELSNPNPNLNPDLYPVQLKSKKNGTPVTAAVRNVHANFDSSTLFRFQVKSPYRTNGRTDRQTDGQDP